LVPFEPFDTVVVVVVVVVVGSDFTKPA